MAFTFFFRDLTPLTYAVKHLVESAMGRSRVRVWDAGCAMGQEPYTLAILLAENMGAFAYRNLEIFATDLDQPLLKILEAGVYAGEELQRIPKELFDKYFEPVGANGHFRVVEQVRDRVQTRHHDLLSLAPVRDGFSLVVCKNVLLHFQHSERVEVIRMFHRALESGGLLVMEHTQKMPSEAAHLFTQIVPDAQLFRKIEA
jgi:chemotaxis protein methyltransferase CheR